MNDRRYFEVRTEQGGIIHLCDSEAKRTDRTLCGIRWRYREPVFDPYADPYAQPPSGTRCYHCGRITNTTEEDPRP